MLDKLRITEKYKCETLLCVWCIFPPECLNAKAIAFNNVSENNNKKKQMTSIIETMVRGTK